MRDIIKKLAEHENLQYGEAKEAMGRILEGRARPIEISAYLTALKMKGETVEEITASAMAMRGYAEKLEYGAPLLEVVGTGGDYSGSFNISTIAAIIASAAGVKVAKHGNRAYTSKCGAADVMEALGYQIDISASESKSLLDETGFCFLFAQKYNKAVKGVSSIRKALGFRTIFNTLGPLCNPAQPDRILLGVFSQDMVNTAAEVLAGMGVESALVVHGMDGMDEISVGAPTKVCKYKDGSFTEEIIYPELLGVKRWNKGDITGGSPARNAQIITDILAGAKGAARDIAILNAGAAIYAGNNFTIPLQDSVNIARECIDSGAAKGHLKRIIGLSNKKAV